MKKMFLRKMGMLLSASMLAGTFCQVPVHAAVENGWETVDGCRYWYENGVKQGTEGRGKEIYDPGSDAWYWLDSVDDGKMAVSKDVYQESAADDAGNIGKWVRYDAEGHMVKGWNITEAGTFYFDPTYGTMAKGSRNIDSVDYIFNVDTGIMESSSVGMESHWEVIDGKDYWYEGGVRQGYDPMDTSYRGKEIYDPGSDAWYWLDNVQQGAKAVSKDVYQESQADDAGNIGKWVRYDAEGHMVKGWNEQNGGKYYFDPVYGTMAKGDVVIDGKAYRFNTDTGVCETEQEVPETPVPEGPDFSEEFEIPEGYDVIGVRETSKGDKYIESQGVCDENGNLVRWKENFEWDFEYDEKGNLTKMLFGNMDMSVCFMRVFYEYDEDGNQIRGGELDDEGNILYSFEYEHGAAVRHWLSLAVGTLMDLRGAVYDTFRGGVLEHDVKGNVTKYSDGEQQIVYEYDEDGNLLREMLYSGSGVLQKTGTYEYDAAGRVMKAEVVKAWDGTIDMQDEYKYGASGNLAEYISYMADGNIAEHREYDAEGRITRRTSYRYNGAEIRDFGYEYEYNAQGEVYKAIEYVEGRVSVESYHDMNGENCTLFFNDDGTPLNGEKCEFDEQGRLIKKVYYENSVIAGQTVYKYRDSNASN